MVAIGFSAHKPWKGGGTRSTLPLCNTPHAAAVNNHLPVCVCSSFAAFFRAFFLKCRSWRGGCIEVCVAQPWPELAELCHSRAELEPVAQGYSCEQSCQLQ